MRKILSAVGILILMSAPLFAAGGLDLSKVDIHGFISQGYVKSSDHDYFLAETEDGTLEFNEFGLNFSSAVTDDLRLGLQFISRDLGEIGNNKVEIDWAYADYNFRNWLGLRVGKVKKADGVFNQYRDVDATRTCIFLPPALYREDARESALAYKGAGIYGSLPGGLEYQAVYGVMELDKDGGLAMFLENDIGADINDTKTDPAYNLWLNWQTPLSGLSIGASTNDFDFDMNGAVISAIPLSAFTMNPAQAFTNLEAETPMAIRAHGNQNRIFSQYRYDNLMLAAEYLWGEHKVDTTVAGMTVTTELEPQGWYVMATYRFCPWLELGTYYSDDLEDKDDRQGNRHVAMGRSKERARLKDLAVSARFDINSYWVFKLEAHFMDGLKDVNYGADPDPDKNWEMYAAKLTYIF